MRLFFAALFSIAFAGFSLAADLGGYKDGTRSIAVQQTLLPTGFYASVGIGETFLQNDAASLMLSSKGLSGDFRVGVDYLLPNTKIVFGPLVGFGVQDVTGRTLSGSEKWDWTIGARAGRIFNSSDLIYVLAAYKQQSLGLQGTGATAVADGAMFGAGIEIDIAPGWTVGTELDYSAYGAYTPLAGLTVNSTDISGKVRLGLRL